MERYQRMEPEHFNDVLDGIADALAMTDAEISEGSGISRQTINGMRGGRARIKPDKLWPLASALGADVEVFFLPDVADAVRDSATWPRRGRGEGTGRRASVPSCTTRRHHHRTHPPPPGGGGSPAGSSPFRPPPSPPCPSCWWPVSR